jgi:L-malate glycosyltransferase
LRKIKVLHVVHWPKSGIVNLLYNQIKYSAKDNIEYMVIFFISDKDTFMRFSELGVKVAGYDYKISFLHNILFKFYNDIRSFKPDIIHTHSFTPGLITRLLKLFNKSYVILSTIHNSYPYLKRKTLIHRIKTFLETTSINRFNTGVIAVSSYVKRYLIENTFIKPDLIDVIKPGIPIVVEKMCEAPSDQPLNNNVIIVGRLDKQKRHDRLLIIWEKVIKKIPDAHLDILGDGSEKQNLINMVKELGLKDSISFLGFKEDVYRFIKNSEFSVLTSDHEGFGLVILESLLLQRPVIAFDVGPLSEIIDEQCGILIKPFDIDMFVEKVIYLLENKNKAMELGREGRKKVIDNFSITVMVESIENKYFKLSQGSKII